MHEKDEIERLLRRLRELTRGWEKLSGYRNGVIHAAAAEKDGKVDFFRTDANVSGGLFMHDTGDAADRDAVQWTKFEVDCITLDNLFEDVDPDLVKIDVEGSEYRVLTGARRILKRGKCRFLVEVHPWGDETVRKMPADVFRLFAEFGYDFRRTHRHWLFEKSSHSFRRLLK